MINLDSEIATEEHRQGMSYGADAAHCGSCSQVAREQRQAACGHHEQVEIISLDGWYEVLCHTCGKKVNQDDEGQ